MIAIPENTHSLDNVFCGNEKVKVRDVESTLMKTQVAAAYLQKSVSWLLRRPDIPYLPGKPNLYKRRDLDHWFTRNMIKPTVR